MKTTDRILDILMSITIGDKLKLSAIREILNEGYDHYILKILNGCEFNGLVGPLETWDAETKIKEMHDDLAYVNNSLFILKITKGAGIDFL